MEKAIIIYGSTTGNTETLSEALEEELQQNYAVTRKNVIDAHPHEMLAYDLIVLGSSTWEWGELQEDFQDFYEGMNAVDLAGKNVAVFGPGDSQWEEFCEAVNLLESKLQECNASLIAPGFKWDGEINDEATQAIKEWGSQLLH
ncbi:MAG: flavodoxin [Syntrophomonadaceae bacterium]|nr:flavodoxin [Syntrophomonadaceae bacterium]